MQWMAHLQVNIADMPTLAEGGGILAHVQALAEANIVYLLASAGDGVVGASPHEHPLLVDGHIVAAVGGHLHLCLQQSQVMRA
jgi:hypothetical protein